MSVLIMGFAPERTEIGVDLFVFFFDRMVANRVNRLDLFSSLKPLVLRSRYSGLG